MTGGTSLVVEELRVWLLARIECLNHLNHLWSFAYGVNAYAGIVWKWRLAALLLAAGSKSWSFEAGSRSFTQPLHNPSHGLVSVLQYSWLAGNQGISQWATTCTSGTV
jgi:hypothetical protein